MNTRRFDGNGKGTALAIYSVQDAHAAETLLDELSADGYGISRAALSQVGEVSSSNALPLNLEERLERCAALVLFVPRYEGAPEDYVALLSIIMERAAEMDRPATIVVFDDRSVGVGRDEAWRLREALRLCREPKARPEKPTAPLRLESISDPQALSKIAELAGLSEAELLEENDSWSGGWADEDEPLPAYNDLP